MQALITFGNALYLTGVILEISALPFGVHQRLVSIGLVVYAIVLWFRPYVR